MNPSTPCLRSLDTLLKEPAESCQTVTRNDNKRAGKSRTHEKAPSISPPGSGIRVGDIYTRQSLKHILLIKFGSTLSWCWTFEGHCKERTVHSTFTTGDQEFNQLTSQKRETLSRVRQPLIVNSVPSVRSLGAQKKVPPPQAAQNVC